VRDDIFVIQYMGLIELRDLSTNDEEPIHQFVIDSEEDESLRHLTDLDMKGDETNLLVCFKDYKVGWLNLRTKQFTVTKTIDKFDGYIAENFIQASFMQSLPGNHFFVYTRGGNCHGLNEALEIQTFSNNTTTHPSIESWRPFSKAIELVDHQNELQTQSSEGLCTIVASLCQGLKQNHALHITRYFGHLHPNNKFQKLMLTPGQNMYSVHQLCTTMLGVSMDRHIELFNVLTF
jgi:hypothetical protein